MSDEYTVTTEQHPSDPMTADERAAEHVKMLGYFASDERVWMETTYAGTWSGNYYPEDNRILGSSRFHYVGYGTAKREKYRD